MEPLSQADRLVALLRQRFAEQARRQQPRPQVAPGLPRPGAPVDPLAAEVARAGASRQAIRQAMIEEMLSERFGTRFTNEPRFQQIIAEVERIMAADAELSALMDQAIAAIG